MLTSVEMLKVRHMRCKPAVFKRSSKFEHAPSLELLESPTARCHKLSAAATALSAPPFTELPIWLFAQSLLSAVSTTVFARRGHAYKASLGLSPSRLLVKVIWIAYCSSHPRSDGQDLATHWHNYSFQRFVPRRSESVLLGMIN